MGIFLTVNYKVISNDTEHDKFVKNPAVGTFGAFDLVCFSTQILHLKSALPPCVYRIKILFIILHSRVSWPTE